MIDLLLTSIACGATVLALAWAMNRPKHNKPQPETTDQTETPEQYLERTARRLEGE